MTSNAIKIKDVFKDHWSSFLLKGYTIRPAVLSNVDKIIMCGEPSMGYAIYHCNHCGSIKHVFFTCKSRFCNSCGAKYTRDRASSISSKPINCPHRHIVFTIPKELRIYFKRDRALLDLLFKASASTVLSWF